MTLLDMSQQYHEDAVRFAERIEQLRQLEAAAAEPQQRKQLHRRILELTPLLRQSRALERVTSRYYDRRYHHAYYQL